ncbi:hypothetical protein M9435_004537 [Picochlorum sp. BPE23]|nr:hypothetical protein M9435_004537 [Picochlorum sp. BPE23]
MLPPGRWNLGQLALSSNSLGPNSGELTTNTLAQIATRGKRESQSETCEAGEAREDSCPQPKKAFEQPHVGRLVGKSLHSSFISGNASLLATIFVHDILNTVIFNIGYIGSDEVSKCLYKSFK